MLCQSCKKRQATVYYTETINGVTRQVALCDSCAGHTAPFGGFDLFGSLFSGSHQPPAPTKRCTLCGSTYREIAERGKLGCAQCYTVFAEELAATLSDMHGADARYVGRGELPQAEPPAPPKAEDPALQEKRAELARAVENEDYERAAILRDEIRALEQA